MERQPPSSSNTQEPPATPAPILVGNPLASGFIGNGRQKKRGRVKHRYIESPTPPASGLSSATRTELLEALLRRETQSQTTTTTSSTTSDSPANTRSSQDQPSLSDGIELPIDLLNVIADAPGPALSFTVEDQTHLEERSLMQDHADPSRQVEHKHVDAAWLDEWDTDHPGVEQMKGTMHPLREHQDPRYIHHEIKISDLRLTFDAMLQDYRIWTQKMSRSVIVEWVHTASDPPSDLRSREMRLHLRDPSTKQEEDSIVWKSTFNCAQRCRRLPKEDITAPRRTFLDELDTVVGRQQREFAKSSQGQRQGRRQPRSNGQRSLTQQPDPRDPFNNQAPDQTLGNTRQRRDDDNDHHNQVEQGSSEEEDNQRRDQCRAKLFVTITLRQARYGLCTISRVNDLHHKPADRSVLGTSPSLRRTLHEMALQIAMTPKRLQQWYMNVFSQRNPYAKRIEKDYRWRRPTYTDFKTAIQTVAAQNLIHKDPLLAIEILAKRCPEAFLDFEHSGLLSQKWVESKQKLRLSCIIGPPEGLENAILYGSAHGHLMDSSWRNKNNVKCPLTIISTICHYHRQIPVATMVSQHADTRAYTRMLSKVDKAIYKRAVEISQGAPIAKRDKALHPEILENAQGIVEQGHFVPAMMMIDGDNAERRAIQSVYPNLPVRACQFHFLQAVRSKCRTFFGRSDKGIRQTQLTMEALRQVQRCPEEDEWADYYKILEETVSNIGGGGEDGAALWLEMDVYLQQSWLSPNWRPLLCDYGMPPGAFRESAWATNNFAESAFRIFDRVILGARSNRRIDRLVGILILNYFPYYELLPHNKARPNPALLKETFSGLNIWQNDLIRPKPLDSPDIPPQMKGKIVVAYAVRDTIDSETSFVGCRTVGKRWCCTCKMYTATGARCRHMWALSTYHLYGRISEYEAQMETMRRRAGIVEEVPRDGVLGEPGENDGWLEETAQYWAGDPLAGDLSLLDTISAENLTSKDPGSIEEDSGARTLRANVEEGHGPEEDGPQDDAPQEDGPGDGDDEDLNVDERRESSPIGRRHKVSAYIRDPDQSSEDDNLGAPPRKRLAPNARAPITGPGELAERLPTLGSIVDDSAWFKQRAGRNPPLEPIRGATGKPQKSSLRPQYKKGAPDRANHMTGPGDSTAPAGLLNNGNDCYALATFQLLARSPKWMALLSNEMRHFSDTETSIPVILAVLNEACGAIKKNEKARITSLHQRLSVLFPTQPAIEQRDPSEFLAAIVHHLNSLYEQCQMLPAFGFLTSKHYNCNNCKQQQRTTRSPLFPMAIAFLSNDPAPLAKIILQSSGECTVISDLECAACSHWNRTTPKVGLSFPGYLLAVQICHDRSDRQGGDVGEGHLEPGRDRHISIRCDIPEVLKLGVSGQWVEADVYQKSEVLWRLVGLVCKVGDDLTQGHYVAIVLGEQGSWWLMNDAVGARCTGIMDCFEDGRSPTLALYERMPVQPPGTPLAPHTYIGKKPLVGPKRPRKPAARSRTVKRPQAKIDGQVGSKPACK